MNKEENKMINISFDIYRMKESKDGRKMKGRPYNEIRKERVRISSDNYRKIYGGELQAMVPLKGLLQKIHEITDNSLSQPVGISDVVVLNRNGETTSYYIDQNRLVVIHNFIRPESDGTVIDEKTKGYQITGKSGAWDAVDMLVLDGNIYYLLECEKSRDAQGQVILDAYGQLIADRIFHGFDDTSKKKIREAQNKPVTAEHPRSANVQRKAPVKDKPGKRISVIKRLHEKQIEVAIKSGKPVPNYLLEEVERNRK